MIAPFSDRCLLVVPFQIIDYKMSWKFQCSHVFLSKAYVTTLTLLSDRSLLTQGHNLYKWV